jgi:hypothetical protein
MTMPTNPLLDAALSYAAQGINVFPCAPKGKIPLTSNGYKDANHDLDIIRQWWTANPRANIGIPTGELNGFFILDIDGLEGEAALKKLEAEHAYLPATKENITGNGRHVFFRYVSETKIACSAGKLSKGLDVRGDGGYIIAPPSIHSSGKSYAESVDSTGMIALAPEWLIKLIVTKENSDAKKAKTNWTHLIQGVSAGQRNSSLARLAGKLFRNSNDPYIVLELCLAWNDARCNPPLPHEEVIRTINSIAGIELKRRGL